MGSTPAFPIRHNPLPNEAPHTSPCSPALMDTKGVMEGSSIGSRVMRAASVKACEWVKVPLGVANQILPWLSVHNAVTRCRSTPSWSGTCNTLGSLR